MKRWIGIALVIAALAGGAAAWADDIVNEKAYGGCLVWTDIDALTDDESHKLACTSETGVIVITGVALIWRAGETGVTFMVGPMFYFESHIVVAWRIDKGDVRTGNWSWSDAGGAFTREHSVFDALLDELPAGKRIVIKVGSEKAIISLDGSAAAVKDFRTRIAQSE